MEEKIIDLLEEKFTEPAFADCFLVDLHHSGKKLEVFVDSDSGMDFEKCQKISRYLETYLDEEKPLGEDYTLEVSSPGVSRPLKFWRQYTKNIGRTVEITMKDGAKHSGTLLGVAPELVTIEEKVRRKEGKRTRTEVVQTSLPYDNIQKTIVKVTF